MTGHDSTSRSSLTLGDLLRHIVASVDVDGRGFRTSDAPEQPYVRISEGRNDLPPWLFHLARREAREGVAPFRPTAPAHRDPAHWTSGFAAINECIGTQPKCILLMTYAEFVGLIEFREQKAAQMRELARQARRVLLLKPDWQASPTMTLADVLGVSE